MSVLGQSTTFSKGTAIIDMGSSSPTVPNSLKPYGLIYSLLKNYHVPVNCAVNATKVKDGIDFIYNGKNYKGGTFIISGDFITSQVQSVLNSWAAQGVLIDYVTEGGGNLTVNVTYKLDFVPKWVMDRANGSIAVGFLNAAGIPSSAYSFKQTSQLGSCDDVFVLPHADPTWNTHNNLYFWNTNQKGAIWAGCHAVSVLESLSKDTVIGITPTTLRMNFLTTNGLLAFTDHNQAATPFSHFLPGDPVAQYISKTDNAQIGGSETVYLPKPGSAWNSSSKIITTSPAQIDVPGLSPGAAVANIYGRAFGDNARGLVAYQSAHNIGGTNADQIAAQRVFFNFSLFAMRDKIPPIISVGISGVPSSGEVRAGTALTVNGVVTGTGSGFTYQWKASVAGTFSASTSATTTFTPSTSITTATACVITCVVTESCGRVSFDSKKITVLPQTPPLSSADITKSIPDGCATGSVTFNVFDSNVNADAGTRTLVTVTGLANGTVISSTTGSVTFTAAANFKGATTGTYTITNGVTNSVGNITINVGTTTVSPAITDDAATAVVNSMKSIDVLANDKVNSTLAGTGLQLYIRDISKPGKGNVYISNDKKSITYLSNNGVTGTDNFTYTACNASGYCSAGTVTITLVDNCGTGKYQENQTLTTLNATLTPTADTYMDNANTTTANGSTDPILVRSNNGTTFYRPLITFGGLSTTLSSTFAVSAASLILTVAADYTHPSLSGNAASLFALTVNPVLKNWQEASATWASASGVLSWTGAGAGTNNSDITTSASYATTFPFSANTALTVSGGSTVTADLTNTVKAWLDGTLANNYGVRINPAVNKTSTFSFYSRENAASTKWPKLSIDYYPCLTTPTSYLPALYPDASTTSSTLSVTISPLANDYNYYGNTNSLLSVTTPANGTATINGNQVIYTPSGSFVGTDTLTYTVKDLTNNQTNTATIRVQVTRVAPVVMPDFATTNSGSAVTFTVTTNDLDQQAAMLSNPVITSAPKNGTAVVNGDKTITYTPVAGFVGKDTLIYSRAGISDDACTSALSDTAIVFITVNNRAPITTTGSLSTFACAPVTIDLLALSSDPEGGALTVTISSNPANGTLTTVSAGKYKYTPNTNFVGTDNFAYTVTDQFNATSLASTVSITISGAANPNTSPIATNDTDSTLTGQAVYTNVLINDSDPNNDVLTISITAAGLTAPQNGTITLMPNKLVKYVPNASFGGTDTYQYKITDSHPGCSTTGDLSAIATVTINVTAVPTTLSGTVYNDLDVSGQPDFTNIKTSTETGTNGNGSIYIYLVDNNNIIKDRTPVDNDGTYTLSNVPSLTSGLKLLVSIEDIAVGNTLTATSLPVGYSNSSPLLRTLPTTTSADMGGYNWGIYTNPILTPGVIITPGDVCGTTVPGTIRATSNAIGGSLTATRYKYQWESSTTSATAGFSSTSVADSLTLLIPSSAISATTYFRRSVTTRDLSNNIVDAVAYSNVVTVTRKENPTATAGNSSPICVGSPLSFTSSGGTAYSWTGPNGFSSSSQNPSISVTSSAASGTYTVVVTAANGCTATATTTATVNALPVITISPSSVSINEGSSVPLTASGANTYSWSPSTGLSATTTATVTAAPLTNTTYSVTGLVTATGCTNTNSVTVTVVPSLILVPGTIGADQTICSGSAPAAFTSITNASGGTGSISYQWQVSTDNSVFTDISGATSSSYTPGTLTQTTYYRRGSKTSVDAVVYSNTVKATVQISVSGTISGGGISVCSGVNSGSLTLSGNTGTVLRWESSVNNFSGTTTINNTTGTVSFSNLTTTTQYRAVVQLGTCASVTSAPVTVTVTPLPVVGPIAGPCALARDSVGTFLVTPVANATSYKWSLPSGWTGTSTTNSIQVKAGVTAGVISVTASNGTCAAVASSAFSVTVIDYAEVTITATPTVASGNLTSTMLIKIQLIDVSGKAITCSGGVATLCSNISSASFGKVTDHNDGTYTAQLTSSANDLELCGTVGGIPIVKKPKVTFTGPQGGIKGNGPILATETPKLTFTFTAGTGPFTVIYRSAKSTKNDTLSNVLSGKPVGVALIPSTTLYTLVSIIDANGERRNDHFNRDTATIIVLAPRIIVTLRSDAPVLEKDSTWRTRLSVHVKNIGDLDLADVQVKLNLKDVFPSPVTYVLDSVRVNGRTVVQNPKYDGIQFNDLFARIHSRDNRLPATIAVHGGGEPQGILSPENSSSTIDNAVEVYANSEQLTGMEENEAAEEEHSVFMFGPSSQLPVGVDGFMFLYLHIKPNGYYEPFVMQAVALGTGHTQEGAALATSLSNDNENTAAHPDITKQGDPLPTVINLIPNPVIGVSLTAGTPVNNGNGTYNVLLTYKLRNYGNVNLQNVKLFQNLGRMIGAPSTFTLVGGITATGTLIPNTSFNAITDTNMLSPNSELGYNLEGTLQFTISITPNQLSSLYRLQAIGEGTYAELNLSYRDLSTDGTNPDPDGNKLPTEKVLTLIVLNLPIPPLVVPPVGININPPLRSTVLSNAYCASASGVRVIPTAGVTGGSGPYEFQWQSSTDNVLFTDIAQATDSVYVSGTFTGTIYLRRKVISDNQVGFSNSVLIQINTVTKPLITPAGVSSLPTNGSVTLTSTVATSYLWSNAATTRSVNITIPGNYSVTTTDANGCTAVSDPVGVRPPPPVTINAIYIIGAISNPNNSGVQVTGMTGATLNYYILSSGGTIIPVPVLPGLVGVYTYYVSQTLNGYESALVPYTVTMIDKVADLQKTLSKAPVLQADGSFLLSFNILATNLRNELLDSVRIKDDLSKVFPTTSSFEVVSIQASGKLVSNSLYNGNTQIDLLASGSQLPAQQTDSVTVTVKLFANGFSGILNNQAEKTAKSPHGVFKVTSNDPSAGNGLTFRAPTKFFIPLVDIFIPSGFSPNRDGVNDVFVITKPYNVSINLEVFNRWGNLVFRSGEYKNEFDGKGNQPNRILGEDLPDGTYYYIVLATDKSNGSVKKFAGFITLKR